MRDFPVAEIDHQPQPVLQPPVDPDLGLLALAAQRRVGVVDALVAHRHLPGAGSALRDRRARRDLHKGPAAAGIGRVLASDHPAGRPGGRIGGHVVGARVDHPPAGLDEPPDRTARRAQLHPVPGPVDRIGQGAERDLDLLVQVTGPGGVARVAVHPGREVLVEAPGPQVHDAGRRLHRVPVRPRQIGGHVLGDPQIARIVARHLGRDVPVGAVDLGDAAPAVEPLQRNDRQGHRVALQERRPVRAARSVQPALAQAVAQHQFDVLARPAVAPGQVGPAQDRLVAGEIALGGVEQVLADHALDAEPQRADFVADDVAGGEGRSVGRRGVQQQPPLRPQAEAAVGGHELAAVPMEVHVRGGGRRNAGGERRRAGQG